MMKALGRLHKDKLTRFRIDLARRSKDSEFVEGAGGGSRLAILFFSMDAYQRRAHCLTSASTFERYCRSIAERMAEVNQVHRRDRAAVE